MRYVISVHLEMCSEVMSVSGVTEVIEYNLFNI